MKPDAYTKTVLTVIAVALIALVLQNLNLIRVAKASTESRSATNTVTLPINEDGTIDVRIKEDQTDKIMDVNLVRVAGNSTRKGVPVKPAQHSMNINVEEVGGYQVYGALPVKNK